METHAACQTSTAAGPVLNAVRVGVYFVALRLRVADLQKPPAGEQGCRRPATGHAEQKNTKGLHVSSSQDLVFAAEELAGWKGSDAFVRTVRLRICTSFTMLDSRAAGWPEDGCRADRCVENSPNVAEQVFISASSHQLFLSDQSNPVVSTISTAMACQVLKSN